MCRCDGIWSGGAADDGAGGPQVGSEGDDVDGVHVDAASRAASVAAAPAASPVAIAAGISFVA